ncbi:ABC transporter permease subunit [Paenibacillus sp. FSL M7-0802]|jgi:nickel transport system permease protein|uniref:ABC transporter permease subunit n=1 Tax=Paenibacillus TaxID=44249 RepID=UPI00047016CB|nr:MULTISPECIES: ABC transporter permease subunit [Paenibacillus]MBP1176378.1 nickel transport system permease protein [Paenibacillus sp. PvR133]SFR12100.1 nickel transport system permease protein [Paenibacillus sp. cl130]
MAGYIFRRALTLVPLVLFATFVAFVLMRLSPVDPAEAYFSAAHIKPNEQMLQEKRGELGLDDPFMSQYVQSAVRMLQLDLGTSYLSSKSVWGEIWQRLPATLQLTGSSMLIAFVAVVTLGYLSAVHAGRWVDYAVRILSYIGASLPQFMLGYLLIYLFALHWDLLPVEGKGTWQHLILPSLTLSLALVATYARLFRESILEQMKQAYVDYAHTRGLKPRSIMLRHVVRLAILPIITGFGMNLGRLITGTIVVERVFSWPGLGRFFVESIFNRDLPVIQGYVFFAACLYLCTSLLTDLLHMAADPRLSLQERSR